MASADSCAKEKESADAAAAFFHLKHRLRAGPGSYLKSKLLYQHSLRNASAKESRILVHGAAIVRVADDAIIENHGAFLLGMSPHTLLEPRGERSLLDMKSGSRLIIQGRFDSGPGTKICLSPGGSLTLGNDSRVAGATEICVAESVRIGARTTIAWDVLIIDSDIHAIGPDFGPVSGPIDIGEHVWIGNGVKILKGVHIGDGSVIAAGSIVTRDIPPNALAAGVPARVVRTGVEWK
jgi:acetyltransferase-like isoleucine patch superfamily enzyme